jgi:PST family polysaccharide transporter
MSKTGAASSLSPLLLNLTQLAASLWLAHKFSIVAAGHFQASAAVATAGLTVVLAALNALYLPRLTSVSEHVGSLVSAELSKIALAVGFAGATLAIAASPVLTLLYTSEFAQVSTTFRWFMLGMALKAIAWVVAYPLLARGKSAPFAIIEVSWACAYLVVLTVLSPLSVAAPGIAYAVAGLLSLVQGAVVTRLRPSVRSLFMVLVVTATLLLLALEG